MGWTQRGLSLCVWWKAQDAILGIPWQNLGFCSPLSNTCEYRGRGAWDRGPRDESLATSLQPSKN